MKFVALASLLALFAVSETRADYSETLLKGLQGVGLKIRPMSIRSDAFVLDETALEEHVLQKLEELHLRLLTEEEVAVMPGQPFLEVVINIAHAQGPSHIYSVSLELREMAELERPKDSIVTIAASTWKRESLGIANRPEAIIVIVDRLLHLFSDELHKANVSESQ